MPTDDWLGRAFGHYGASSALQEPHTARPNQSSVGMGSTNPRGGSMGLQGPPYAVLSPLVTDPLAPPGDPESSLFLTCHFVRKDPTRTKSPDWAKLERLIPTLLLQKVIPLDLPICPPSDHLADPIGPPSAKTRSRHPRAVPGRFPAGWRARPTRARTKSENGLEHSKCMVA